MTALVQGLAVAVAQTQGVPIPGLTIPGLPIPGSVPQLPGRPVVATPGARAPASSAATGGRIPVGDGGDEFFMIVASALPAIDDNYRKHPACRYMRPIVRSALVSDVSGGKREIEATANALRARGHQGVQVSYYPESRGMAPFQEWDRAEETGYDACHHAVRSGGAAR